MNTKTLIAYYSRRGENYYNGRLQKIEEGNTEHMAKVIQAVTGSDLYEIETVHEYPKGYTETTRVAKVEYQNQARPEFLQYQHGANHSIGLPIGCRPCFESIANIIIS